MAERARMAGHVLVLYKTISTAVTWVTGRTKYGHMVVFTYYLGYLKDHIWSLDNQLWPHVDQFWSHDNQFWSHDRVLSPRYAGARALQTQNLREICGAG